MEEQTTTGAANCGIRGCMRLHPLSGGVGTIRKDRKVQGGDGREQWNVLVCGLR